MRQVLLVSMGVFGVLYLGACNTTRRGGAGESCTSTDDCKSGFGCFGQVCRAVDGGTSGASEGGTCGARRDCAPGLACIDETCQVVSQGTDVSSSRYSVKGESCQATNDCEPGLACLMGMCRSVDVSISRAPKNCYRVECGVKEDCCQAFVPNPNCAAYEANCAMDPVFCNTYRSLCLCAQDCVEEQCIAAAPGCKSNAECPSTQTPYCVEGKCRQCDRDAACATAGSKCSDGVCKAACVMNENCPLLHACEDGVCVETGCKSDRECAFLTKNQAAVCGDDGECEIPCEADAECVGMVTAMGPGMVSASRGFEVCEMGKCVFVGCETHSECRALLGIENERGQVQAVCR